MVDDLFKSDLRYIEEGAMKQVDFSRALDESNVHIGFNNGVYDVMKDRFYPRNKVPPEILVSKSTGYDYRDVDEEVRADMDWLEKNIYAKTWVDAEHLRRAKSLLGSLLLGGNKDQITSFWIGRGSNGKTFFIENVIFPALGEYAGDMPNTVLTEFKESADGCTPVICRLRNLLVVSVSELNAPGEPRSNLNLATFKSMSSGDRRTFRNLYGSSFSAVFKPQILVASNEVPRLPVNEPSISRRVHGLDFQSTFSAEVNADNFASKTFIKHDLTEETRKRRLASFHLLLRFFRDEYRAYNNRIYEGEAPSTAIEMMQESAPFGDFEDHIDDRYERIDRAHIRGQANFCVHVSEVVDAYNQAQARGERPLDARTAKQLLAKIGLWDTDNHRKSQKINNKRDMVLLKKRM
jgi:hypothetical protein